MQKLIIFILLALLPAAVFSTTVQCPRYSVALQGTTVFMGASYHERLEAHKVGAGSGYNGRWKVDRFEQIATYPWNINFPIATDNVSHLGGGITMRSQCTVSGNIVTCISTSDTMFLEVVNNRVRMERTAPWHGDIKGSTMSWKFHRESPTEPVLTGIIAEAPKEYIQLVILEPRDKQKYVYSSSGDALELSLRASTTPEHYADSVEWSVPEMEGVKRKVLQGQLKGRKLDVTYQDLPAENSEFGRKKVVATLKVGACTASEAREVQFFYPRDAKNNPGGEHYNWFYYWRQTPAAIPFGQKINIEFGGTQFDVCKDFHVPAMYKPAFMYKTIHICDLTKKLGVKFGLTFPAVKRSIPKTLTVKNTRTTYHIDTFAVLVRHEFIHFNCYHTWREGKTLQQMAAQDADLDGIPNDLEPGMQFQSDKFQTYWGYDPEWKKIGGDEEFLAYESMYDYKDGAYDEYDWAKPGKNWP